MTSISVTGAWLINDRWSARVAVGFLRDGHLKPDDGSTHEVDSGGVIALGAENRVLVGDGSVPYVDLSLAISSSWAKTLAPGVTDKTSYSAADVRFGGRAGWDIDGTLFPYAAVRIFGGPVSWELDGRDVTGSDTHHYQIAAGAAAQVGPVGIFAEWAGLGEKGFGVGISATW